MVDGYCYDCSYRGELYDSHYCPECNGTDIKIYSDYEDNYFNDGFGELEDDGEDTGSSLGDDYYYDDDEITEESYEEDSEDSKSFDKGKDPCEVPYVVSIKLNHVSYMDGKLIVVSIADLS